MMKNILSGPHFLDWNDKFHVTTSVAFQRTKNNSGFNFTVENGFSRIYYHAPTTKDLNPGRYIICFTQSKLVSERNDAFAVISEADFKQYVMSEVCSPSLNTQFVQFVKRNTSLIKMVERAVWQKLSQLIASESENERQISQVLSLCTTLKLDSPVLLAQLNSGQICTPELFEEKLIKTQWDKLLPSAIRVRAAKTLFDNFDDVPAQVAVCIQKSILTPEIKALAAKVVIADPVLANSFPLQTFVQLCAATAFNPNKEEFENLFSVVDHQKSKVVAQYLPIELIADFPSYVSLTQLLEHLSMPEISEPESILQQVFARIESNEAEVSKGDIAYLNRTLKKEHLQDSVNAHFKNIDNVKATLLCKLSDSIDLAPQLKSAIRTLLMNFQSDASRCFLGAWRADLAVKYLDDSVREAISQNYSEFLDTFEEGQEVLCDALPLEHLPLYAKYVTELRLNEYLQVHGEASSLEALSLLRVSAVENNYFESQLLIALFEQKLRQGGASVQRITALFDDFQKGLFEHHAKSRTRIELSILAVCQWLKKEQVISGDRFSKRSVCEGKLWFAKVKDDNGKVTEEKEPKALCRRNDCTMCVFAGMENIDPFKGKPYQRQYVRLPRALTFTGLPFYTMVHQLFGITAEHLHQHDAFVRMLSAINRWNEILEKLICRQCDNPLQIAEHAKGSIGHLAVGTTYWHCGSETCASYGESVKISYCIGCQKYIDSRDDQKSCTPYEIRSYKKFYICNDCGSCCSKHSGFAGICPHCGRDGAFTDIVQKGRTRAKCKHCNAVTNIGHFAFQVLQKHKASGGAFSYIRSLSKSPCHLAGAVTDGAGNTHWLVADMPWQNQTLYIFDLYDSLRTKKITRQTLSKYNEVYDLKVIEKLALLGVDHSRYGVQKVKSPLEQLFKESIAEGSFQRNQNAIFDLVRRYFKTLHDTDVWPHYNNVEHKFTTALHALSEQGFNLSESDLKEELAKLERSRNQHVQKLSALKVFDTDKPSLINYLIDKFTLNEAELLVSQLERHGAKPLRNSDYSFEHLHCIEKTERAAPIVQKLLALPRNVKPHYQIVGTSTSRCTSRSPNLMNLPKESRHILKAGHGNSIIECDYKQVEIGVLAALSGDRQLISDFNTGDVYERFGTALAVSREQAKVVLLGLIYGMSASTIATQLGVTKVIAETYINCFFARYPDVKKYQNELVTQGIEQGYVSSCTGLRRSVNRLVTKSPSILNWEQNWFKNFPIQASAAAVFKLSIVELAGELQGEQFKLLVPHYDAIVFEVPENQTNHYTAQVKAAMHRAMKKQFPILEPQIDVKSCGKSWGEQIQEVNTSDLYQRQGIDDLPF
ncbi:TPA: DNA polymerase [Vibrio vulnificus]